MTAYEKNNLTFFETPLMQRGLPTSYKVKKEVYFVYWIAKCSTWGFWFVLENSCMKYFQKFYEIVIKIYWAIVILTDKFVSVPYFGDAETEITVQQGEAAFFNCHVFNLANQTVSKLISIN